MIKIAAESSAYEKVFVRQALCEAGIRLDGRGTHDYREISLSLDRSERCATAELQWGSNTFVICTVAGEIVAPYPDRPTEGVLQFNAEVSNCAELQGLQSWEIVRMLERSIRESDALDTESLCIVAAESVWLIRCEVRVLDSSGGNSIDACMFAAMAALRAFRKPEISVLSSDDSSGKIASQSSGGGGSSSSSNQRSIMIHHSNDREPLPLSLQHTPLAVSLGLISFNNNSGTSSNPHISKQVSASVTGSSNKLLFLCDPTANEDAALDGKMVFSINAHSELCAINKPAGLGLKASTIAEAAHLANSKANMLHETLKQSLAALEADVLEQREKTLERMRKYQFLLNTAATTAQLSDETTQSGPPQASAVGISGVDRSDPILDWSRLHQPAGLWDEHS